VVEVSGERLLSTQSRMLERIATTVGIDEALAELCLEIEKLVPDSVCTIMLLDPDAGTLSMLSAEHYSRSMCAAFDGLRPSAYSASCGSAAYSGEMAIVEDTATDPRWASYIDLARELGIGACWSIPVFCDGEVVGTFAISSPSPRTPTEYDMSVLRTACHLTGIALGRRRAEESRRAMDGRIQQKRRLESLGVLTGGIAHDFNNLLTGAIGNLDLSEMALSSESPARPFLKKVESAMLRMAELSEQMLAYSGSDTLDLRSLSLGDLVREMAELLEDSISKNATMRVVLAEKEARIQGDAARLRQVIMNLITNASDALAGAEGAVDLRVGASHVDRASLAKATLGESLAPKEYAWFEVEDSGTGMDSETRDKMFEPFFTTKDAGHGLGLAAILGIVRSHEGAIEIDSTLGLGTRIRVLIPASDKRDGRKDSDAAVESAVDDQQRLVLVVDDESSVRSFAASALASAGFEVLTADDGETGIRLFESRADDIDAVLLDFTMPGVDGAEVMQAIHRRKRVPIVLTSGHSKKNVTRGIGEELAGYLQKPYRARELSTLFARVLSTS